MCYFTSDLASLPFICVLIPVSKTKRKYKLRLGQVSELGLGPRTVGRKATAFFQPCPRAIGFFRQSLMGGCEENGVQREKELARWEAPQGVGCPPSWLPPARGSINMH